MTRERDVLKTLLIKEELEVLENLKKKLLSEEQFTEEVSKVLANALKRAQKKDSKLDIVLAKPIQDGVTKTFSENKQSIIDSLLPIMGQLIRKTVTNSIKQFVADINRTLELGFSAKALKWRWQSYKTGIPFAEIVFEKTIRYQVNEIFIIDNETGLLVQHVGKEETLKDKNAMSAMLTAIKDFVGDSLQSTDSGLMSADFGDSQILIATGPKVYLAMIVKGSPSERLKELNQKLIEEIHSNFSDSLLDTNNFQSIDGIEDFLRPYLVTKNITEEKKSINWVPWIIGLLLIISGLSYLAYKRHTEFNQAQNIVNSTPGLYLQELKKSGDGFVAKGLLDPDADVSQLKENNIQLETKPFISLDEEIIDLRINNILKPYSKVNYNLDHKTLSLTGYLPNDSYKSIFDRLNKVTGINSIRNTTKPDFSMEVEEFLLNHNNLEGVSYNIEPDKLTLNGSTKLATHNKLITELKQQFPEVTIEDSQLDISDSTEKIISQIERDSVVISDESESHSSELLSVIEQIKTLINRFPNSQITIIGESDCQGLNSDRFSQQRADSIKALLIENMIEESHLRTSITPCENFNNDVDDSKKIVRFKTYIEQ